MKDDYRIAVKVRRDGVSPVLKDMGDLAESNASLKKVLQLFLDIPDFFNKIATVKVDESPTGADELFVALEPTDSFRNFSAAFLAGDINRLTIEHRNLLKI